GPGVGYAGLKTRVPGRTSSIDLSAHEQRRVRSADEREVAGDGDGDRVGGVRFEVERALPGDVERPADELRVEWHALCALAGEGHRRVGREEHAFGAVGALSFDRRGLVRFGPYREV